MTPETIRAVRDQSEIAAVVMTRNGTYWIVDQEGRPSRDPNSNARYELVEWDDDNELCVVRTRNLIRSDQFSTLVHLNYGAIDELITVE